MRLPQATNPDAQARRMPAPGKATETNNSAHVRQSAEPILPVAVARPKWPSPPPRASPRPCGQPALKGRLLLPGRPHQRVSCQLRPHPYQQAATGGPPEPRGPHHASAFHRPHRPLLGPHTAQLGDAIPRLQPLSEGALAAWKHLSRV